MERKATYPDLKINGVGQASGGTYREVRIDGVSRLKGDIECEKLRLNGMATAQGTIRARELECDGKLNAVRLLEAGNAVLNGMIKVKGEFRGEKVELNGYIVVQGDLSAESFHGRGCVEVGGLLNAGEVDLTAEGRCTAREIGGESIRIRRGTGGSRWRTMWSWAIPKLTAITEADTIEGDRIDLEHTTASVVRGSVVHVGRGCKIGRVEYTEELKVHPEAKVDDQVKV